MATTFKAIVYADNKKQDGTYNVKIRVTHNRKNLKVSTNFFVTANDLTRNTLNLKSQDVIDDTSDMIRKWRKIIERLGTVANTMDVRQIVDYIKEVELLGDKFTLDFIAFGRKVTAAKACGTARSYTTSLNALERYLNGRQMDVSQVNAKFLSDFEVFIATEPVWTYSRSVGNTSTGKSKANGRAVSLYLSCIRHIHNEAKKEYNDEDTGLIRIPQSPFKKYTVKKPPRVKKKAIETQLIQQIIDLSDIDRRDGSVVDLSRRDLARDCFLLSFALAGMNAADLYACGPQNFGDDEMVIKYNRQKTMSRRSDEAEMHIRVEACIAPLLKKYSDPSGERLFCFHHHYGDSSGFGNALGKGLKQVEVAIGANKHFTFYSARHSWATIGRSKALNIDKYTIHEGLNHADSDMKVTDIYIDRDWSVIWDANAQILRQFDWTHITSKG